MAEEKKFCRVPVKLIIKFVDPFPFDTYLKLSDAKIVKISHENEDIKSSIIRYHQTKGVQDIYIDYNDYIKFTIMIKATFNQKLFDPTSSPKEQVDLLEKSFEMIKESISTIGIKEETIAMAERISEGAMKIAKDYPNVFNLIKLFSSNCPEEFRRAVIIGHICSAIIDTFDWKSDAIKEKCTLAAMLCDVQISPQELTIINSISKDYPLTDEQNKLIAIHPAKTVLAFKNEKWISREVLTIIEQHHEEPDGSGFPNKLTHTRIAQLSAIVIVGMRFTDLLLQGEIDIKKRNVILFHMRSKYSSGPFRKCLQGLSTAVNEKLEN